MRLDIRLTSPVQLISEVPPRCEAQARIPVDMIPKQLEFMPGQSLIETQSLDCRDFGFNPQGLPTRVNLRGYRLLQAQDIDHASDRPPKTNIQDYEFISQLVTTANYNCLRPAGASVRVTFCDPPSFD